MNKYLLLFLAVVSFSSFSSIEIDMAQNIIDKAIEKHGGTNYDPLKVEFDFRDKHYVAIKKEGLYQYERIFSTKDGERIHDVLKNSGFARTKDQHPVILDPKKEKAYSNSVNSVIYFALLPDGLNDPAVKKNYLGKVSIHGSIYHKIEITFHEEGGGDDFSDVFVYWIHEKELTVDYLGYSYHVDGGGLRFRQAYNRRKIGKILFQDYINFKTESLNFQTAQLDSLFLAGSLKELSRIELKKIRVSRRVKY